MKLKKLLIPVLIFMVLFTIFIGVITFDFFKPKPNENNIESEINVTYEKTDDYYINNKVGYTMSIVGEVNRNIPSQFKNEGLGRYPIYNTNYGFSEQEKLDLIKENEYLRASDNTYDSMDEFGNLYLNDVKLDRKLYKHSASENNYLGDVANEEKAVVKKITIYPDKLGSYVTGLYAAPGEVITITASDEDIKYLTELNNKYNIKDSKGKVFPAAKIIIGQKQERETRENNIWPARDFVRMPLLANTMNINSTTTYAGSFLGGPVYIDLGDKVNISPIDRKPVTFTISGALEYHHYIHGLTTISDYERTEKSTAPFFELAVTDNLVRFSGARKYATNVDGSHYTYDDAYECAKLWTKIARTSHQVPVNSTTNASISFLFEPFVAAGAAVAFPSFNWVNAPLGWFSGALDAHSFVNNGYWGDIHEFNHHHQNYGYGTIDERMEVSNNATSLLAYSLHTNISSRRQKDKTGVMGDYWNEFMNPEYALKDTLAKTATGINYSLSGYADLIHAFGVENFINITNKQYSYKLNELTNNDERWYYATSVLTGYDMTYYMNDILHLKLNDNIKRIVKNLNYPTFIPGAIAYQTGRGYLKDDKVHYSNTTLPYILDGSGEEIIDLNKDLVLPTDFKVISVNFSKPKNGKIENLGLNKFKYTYNDNSYGLLFLDVLVENKNLNIKQTLNFKLEFKANSNNVEVKDYVYSSEKYNPNTDSKFLNEEFENGFTNALKSSTSFDNDARVDGIKRHHITLSSGKIYIPRTATYQFGLNTDKASYLYVSKDNINYELKAYADSWTFGSFDSTGTKGFSIDLNKGDYLYYKLVTGMPHNDNGYGEIGWGIKNEPDKNPRLSRIDSSYVMGVNDNYEEFQYREYPLEDLTNNYESYIDNSNLEGFNINDNSCYKDDQNTFGLLNIFDNDPNTRHHSKHHISSSKPLEFSIDLGSVHTFNTIEFTKFGTALEAASDFDVYIGQSRDDINTLVKTFSGLTRDGNNNVSAVLDEEVTTQFVRLVIRKTTSNRFFICADILFKNTGIDHFIHHDSPNMEYEINKYKANYNVLGTFGKTYDITDGHFRFRFNGTGFIINSGLLNNNVKLTIKVDNNDEIVITNVNSNDIYKLTNLTSADHEVVVKVEGTLNLNAIKYYK